ncbi:LD-carboxypeptidase [Paenibacillus sp. LHD-117]|uniref:S66 family peptidase n=1 Tax=Paenibacillus sp. LHD-117 TaxID=3071412 RepID=UPI0027DEF5C4|nr:LD-carboxypeptidase [Paenibacillus sp. LHD-117]MDQ6420166.1 LD-carboxypeptidase [Paenibacillus sp. LHD-117]
MIIYPSLKEHATIGVTAPSSGVQPELHELIRQAAKRLQAEGFGVATGDTVWTQHKAKSAPAAVRAAEWMDMMTDEAIDVIIPPWGGELLIELLPFIDFSALRSKWLLGYSDTSALLLAVTLATGIATAHGTNLIDLRGEESDATTAEWLNALRTPPGGTIVQHSSERYQKEWNFDAPSPCVFHLTEPTVWKTASGGPVRIEGRLLGGCIDIIRHLVGTPYGNVAAFVRERLENEPIVWYFENCDSKTTDLRRTLVQMRLAGWFDRCSGILFGRSEANQPVEGYAVEDVYREISEEVGVPLIYDIDCGHVPPQITFINGAYAEIEAAGGQGTVTQHFRP